jgi:hypothetical protein
MRGPISLRFLSFGACWLEETRREPAELWIDLEILYLMELIHSLAKKKGDVHRTLLNQPRRLVACAADGETMALEPPDDQPLVSFCDTLHAFILMQMRGM